MFPREKKRKEKKTKQNQKALLIIQSEGPETFQIYFGIDIIVQ